ncbi:MAG TPA: cell division protein FtsZ [Firmicutes bacterium]|nr:cell division protein FtsZ [Bacillota bacterium]
MENTFDRTLMPALIKVVGVGGAGNNAVNSMIEAKINSAKFIAINTDLQDLGMSQAETRIQIGDKFTKGQGAGADPEKGQKAAEESKNAIASAIKDADLVFITAGMGGGTGTGASPVIASIAKEMGKLTVAVVTKPFAFEGKPRMANANIGIENLKKVVDTIVIIPNEKLMEFVPNLPIKDAFRHADDVLRQGIQGISDLIVTPALINLDFADVCTVMRNSGVAHMGIGRGKGEKRVLEAVKRAVFSPLLETSIEGASKIILNIMGSPDMTLNEINEATSLVREVVQPNANIIFGADIRETMKEEIMVTMIATGFNNTDSSAQSSQQKTQAAPIDDPFRAEYDAMFDQRFGAQHAGFGQPARPQQPVNQYPTGNQAPRPVQQQQAPRGSRMTVDEDDDMPAWMRKLKK